MGPPREHGGMGARDARAHRPRAVAMGPPREHGGMLMRGHRGTQATFPVAMGPPREHGGMVMLRVLKSDAKFVAMGPPREHGGMPSSRTAMHSWSYGEGCERVGFVVQKGRILGRELVFCVSPRV